MSGVVGCRGRQARRRQASHPAGSTGVGITRRATQALAPGWGRRGYGAGPPPVAGDGPKPDGPKPDGPKPDGPKPDGLKPHGVGAASAFVSLAPAYWKRLGVFCLMRGFRCSV
ncbi:hypothetical protein Abr02nite_77430 [Paractinoplanes brasiliensis]|nr:hypothetical protein Abr02nite_77430 [Actinoplanes brasiliensis]